MSSKKTIFNGLNRAESQRGATAILLSFFVMNILLLVSLTAASIMVFNIKMSAEIADSVPAFYAADAGSEGCLYQTRILGFGCGFNMSLGNSATVNAWGVAGNKINSRGTYKAASRTIEVSW